MPHLAGTCHCGRPIHFPKDAAIGYRWTCRKCGHAWIMQAPNTPGTQILQTRPSKAPKPERAAASVRSQGRGVQPAAPQVIRYTHPAPRLPWLQIALLVVGIAILAAILFLAPAF